MMAQVTEVREVREVQEAEKAPVSERPTQNNVTISVPNPQEMAALEAIRKGLCSAGIDHDDLDYIAGKVMTKLDDAGLLRKSALDVARGIEPDAWTDSMVWLHPHRSRSPRRRAVAEKIAAALVAEFGGVVVDDDDGTPSEDYRRIRVNVERADYYVPYDPEEG